MENNTVLSIIVLAYNMVNFTKGLVNDLMKLPNTYEIVIVDNGSTDDTEKYCVELQVRSATDSTLPRVLYLKQDKNLGFGPGNNIGYAAASGKNILFLNNDVKVQGYHSDWPEELIKECEGGNIVATQMGLLDKSFNFVREGTDINVYNPLSYLSGWFIGASRETLDKLILAHRRDHNAGKIIPEKACGPWNELYELYFEDDDLTFRARKLGITFKIISVPLYHIGRVTGKKFNLFHKYHESRRIFIKEWKGKV